MILTDEQKHVIKGIITDLGKKQIITLGGLAGCGKTTCIRYINEILFRQKRKFAVAAFTGKATNVLRKKKIDAKTIHSTIYQPTINFQTGETEWRLTDDIDDIGGFIIDEASMISKELHRDIISFNKPVIYVGDHGQLEPIGTNFNLMENPDYKLETIHRNAGEIARFAYHLREGNSPCTFETDKKVQVVKHSAILDSHLSSVDQVICAFNKTRVQLNERVRNHKKIAITFIAKNEKVMCLRNNQKLGLFNGMQGKIKKVYKNYTFDFETEDLLYDRIKYSPDQFGREKYDIKYDDSGNPFDYAYAITAHKSQGDEFGSVLAIEERCNNWDHTKWCYTVASRAKSSLIWVTRQTYMPTYLS